MMAFHAGGSDLRALGVRSSAQVLLLFAQHPDQGAARSKIAADDLFSGAWLIPFKKNSRTGALKLWIRDGNRGHESTRVGMLRVLKDILDGAVFNDATQIHDRDVIGDLAHNGEVVSHK